MNFQDAAELKGVKKTAEGYLLADAFTVRTGIQIYAGYEVGMADKAQVRVYRPENEVFNKDSVHSFAHVPVTNDHPSVPVTSANWKDFAVGEVSTDAMRDGERLKLTFLVKDKATIDLIESGKRELSAGYSCDLAIVDGTTPSGETYDAIQTNIRGNHVALVQRGRAGPDFRIGDSSPNWGAAPLIQDKEVPVTTRTMQFDGIDILVTDQAAQAIGKLQTSVSTLTTDLAAAKTTIAAKDAEIGTLKVEVAQTKDALPTGAALDKLVKDRTALIADAMTIVKDLKIEGLSDAEIRKAAVSAKFGDTMVKDASDEQIAGMFKASIVKTDAKNDPFRQAVADRTTPTLVADNGQGEYEKNLTDAWKTKRPA